MSKLPLFTELPQRILDDPYTKRAYTQCLNLEEAVQRRMDAKQDVGRSMIYCRILGYLLIHPPNDQARARVRREILSVKTDQTMLDLGQRYFDHFIRAFRSTKGPVPTPSRHPSRPSFDTLPDMIKEILQEAPQSHSVAKMQALVRDGFRCAISGVLDRGSVAKNLELLQLVPQEGRRPVFTQCAHIISESTNANITSGSAKASYAATVWSILQLFGCGNLLDELNGSKIHSLENVITMDPNIHASFDALQLWLMPMKNEDNKYRLEARNSIDLIGLPEYVTFTSREGLPVPKREYLELHATCAKVAHLSGAAEYIDKIHRDMEEITVLSSDGASADILEHALLTASPRPVLV